MDDKYDSALLGILQHEGKVEKFLNVILGFLYRRTDFYRIMKSKEDKLGFPPGMALKMLNTIFHQYDGLTRRDDQLRETRAEEMARRQAGSNKDTVSKAPPAENRSSEQDRPTESAKTQAVPPVLENNDTNNEQLEQMDTDTDSASVKPETDKPAENISSNSGSKRTDISNKASSENVNGDKAQPSAKSSSSKEDDDPELTKQQQLFQSNPESYNGAVRDNYSWAQSITDVDMRVKVPSYIRKGRDVKVDIAKKHVKVSHKDDKGQWKVVVDGDLTWEVNKEESMWTLNPGENVHINFEKREERWWEAALTDEPKISVRKIDASRPMTDLDDEAQAKIEEMMYNDRQKKLGLPTAQEQKMQDMLKNAWDAEGSPFKGQEFDPSKFSMDSSGMINMKPS